MVHSAKTRSRTAASDAAAPARAPRDRDALRERAEQWLARHPAFTVVQSDTDSVRLIHELQLHQTELEMQNEALRESRAWAEAASERLELALDAAGAGLWDWDLERHALHLSSRCRELLGVLPGMSIDDPAGLLDRIHPEDEASVGEVLRNLLDEPQVGPWEFRLQGTEGAVWVQCAARVTARRNDGTPQRVVGTLTDISARKCAEEQLRIAAVAFQSGDAMVVTDAGGRILQVNRAFTEVTGYSAEEAIGQTPALMKSGRHDGDFYRNLWEAVKREGSWEGEIWNRRKDGTVFAEWLRISGVRDAAGAITHYLGTFSDISDPRERERKIVELAFYDPLTGLPNRRLFMDRLRQALVACGRSSQFGAVLLVDLDQFKMLNDTRGHNAGDELLGETARRLRASLRETDSAARLGGDEFVVLLEGLNADQLAAANAAEAIAEKLRLAIGEPGVSGGREHRVTPSIGITLFGDARGDAESLLRQADLALYQAKAAGRNTVRFYSPEMQAAVDARADMEAGLRRALAEGELELHYQPKVELRRGRIVGAEALLRWRDSRSGTLVPPDAFIPLAEENGLIVPIGEWVIGEACRQIAAWRGAGLPVLRIAVNVSGRQFQQADLGRGIARALDDHGVEPEWLELELTESAVMAHPDRTAATLHELKHIGVSIALDDFGTGYSSLGHLKRFPIDGLKIDRSFVRDITGDADSAAIAAMIIALAHSLGQTVVAEGVETEDQLKLLQQQGCDEMQGYFFSRPLPVREFTALLRSERRLGA
ncbi:MAG TPA: EAL domain-containing protein [Rhodocyclaceae bacterium]